MIPAKSHPLPHLPGESARRVMLKRRASRRANKAKAEEPVEVVKPPPPPPVKRRVWSRHGVSITHVSQSREGAYSIGWKARMPRVRVAPRSRTLYVETVSRTHRTHTTITVEATAILLVMSILMLCYVCSGVLAYCISSAPTPVVDDPAEAETRPAGVALVASGRKLVGNVLRRSKKELGNMMRHGKKSLMSAAGAVTDEHGAPVEDDLISSLNSMF